MNMSAVSFSAQEETKVNLSQDNQLSEISSQGWVNDLVDVLDDHVSEPEVPE